MNEHEQILTSILDCRRIDLYIDQKILSSKQKKQFDDMLERRARGEPLQYIIGESPFINVTLQTDERALIPRPETEILAEVVLKSIEEVLASSNQKTFHILDLGTGSGNIAIFLAKSIPNIKIVALDQSFNAIRYNCVIRPI